MGEIADLVVGADLDGVIHLSKGDLFGDIAQVGEAGDEAFGEEDGEQQGKDKYKDSDDGGPEKLHGQFVLEGFEFFVDFEDSDDFSLGVSDGGEGREPCTVLIVVDLAGGAFARFEDIAGLWGELVGVPDVLAATRHDDKGHGAVFGTEGVDIGVELVDAVDLCEEVSDLDEVFVLGLVSGGERGEVGLDGLVAVFVGGRAFEIEFFVGGDDFVVVAVDLEGGGVGDAFEAASDAGLEVVVSAVVGEKD